MEPEPEPEQQPQPEPERDLFLLLPTEVRLHILSLVDGATPLLCCGSLAPAAGCTTPPAPRSGACA